MEVIMSWVLEGMHIRALYLGDYEVEGRVEMSRVAFGGQPHHTVVLDTPLKMPWNTTGRDRVIVEHKDVLQIRD